MIYIYNNHYRVDLVGKVKRLFPPDLPPMLLFEPLEDEELLDVFFLFGNAYVEDGMILDFPQTINDLTFLELSELPGLDMCSLLLLN